MVWFCVFQSMLNRCWINQRHFRSIKPNFISIENYIEIFLKTLSFTCSSLFQIFSNTILSLFDRSKGQSKFLSFSSESFARFLSSKAGKTFILLIFHWFSSFMHFGDNFESMTIWVFWWFKHFLSQLINGFLLWDIIQLFYVN